MLIVAVDPSGSFEEGKGETGIIKYDTETKCPVGSQFKAKKFSSREEYWEAMIKDIAGVKNSFVVIESFRIRDVKFLRGSSPETLQFIGALTHYLTLNGIPFYLQDPGSVKYRFKDEILLDSVKELKYDPETKYYRLNGKIINAHIRDALRHLLFFLRYNYPKYLDGTLHQKKKKKRRTKKWKTS